MEKYKILVAGILDTKGNEIKFIADRIRSAGASRDTIDRKKANLDVLPVDRHMNDAEFADIMSELLDEMLNGSWKEGSHQNLSGIVKF